VIILNALLLYFVYFYSCVVEFDSNVVDAPLADAGDEDVEGLLPAAPLPQNAAEAAAEWAAILAGKAAPAASHPARLMIGINDQLFIKLYSKNQPTSLKSKLSNPT